MARIDPEVLDGARFNPTDSVFATGVFAYVTVIAAGRISHPLKRSRPEQHILGPPCKNFNIPPLPIGN